MTVHIYNEQAHSMPQMAAALPQNDKYGYQAHLQRIHKETPRHSCLTDQHDLILNIIHHHDEKINLLRNNKAPLSAIFIVIINKYGSYIILCICIKLFRHMHLLFRHSAKAYFFVHHSSMTFYNIFIDNVLSI